MPASVGLFYLTELESDLSGIERVAEDNGFLKKLASTVKACIKKRFVAFSELEALAVLLDPEAKNLAFVNEGLRNLPRRCSSETSTR